MTLWPLWEFPGFADVLSEVLVDDRATCHSELEEIMEIMKNRATDFKLNAKSPRSRAITGDAGKSEPDDLPWYKNESYK